MKPLILCFTLAAGLLLNARTQAEEPKTNAPAGPGIVSGAADKAKPTPDELEADFMATMTNATMAGRWCMIQEGALGPSKEDKYTIVSATKAGGDVWIIKARIQYGSKDIVAPIPVKVKWAGDTPVIVVDKLPLPGGVYRARVLIYGHTYAGTWNGGDHGGLLNGVITNAPPDEATEKK